LGFDLGGCEFSLSIFSVCFSDKTLHRSSEFFTLKIKFDETVSRHLSVHFSMASDDANAFLSRFAFFFPVGLPSEAAEEGTQPSTSMVLSFPHRVLQMIFPFWATFDPSELMHHVEVRIIVIISKHPYCILELSKKDTSIHENVSMPN
jgi:hypothetical protein